MAPKVATPRQQATEKRRNLKQTNAPVLGVTGYDNVRAFMCAIVLGLIIGVIYLYILYRSQLEPVVEDRVALELIEIPGGAEDGCCR